MKNFDIKTALLANSSLASTLPVDKLTTTDILECLVGNYRSIKVLQGELARLSTKEVITILYRQPQLVTYFDVDAISAIPDEWVDRLTRQNPELADSLQVVF